MSALREGVEGSASPLLSVHKRMDVLLLALADVYRKFAAVNVALTSADSDELAGAFHALLDGEHSKAIFEAEAKLRRTSPEALERFIAERDAAKRREPFISTDRSPRILREGGIPVYDEHGQPVIRQRPGGQT